ncbi:DUF5302 domain-containing protein [Mycobacterium bourgelatii]|uniref:DUF5302 domain-containing protein n=1 Tax=Mycobacterium bourgelatii TaxID=1273442 RepID=A0A7I9YUI9_MYCBU|nr:DUF5302 domain-containing protein [Mycobacterium bourgelatii]MCV6974896.1 DUF5302 domain-containing protein [Mycobacterium bourgelatii]GFG92288.1 hypothetical protein MBOU_43300 [Mycobacterium bourgelatii]
MPESESPADETKRKFREALDRKLAKSAGSSDHKDGSDKKSHGPHGHGPEGNRREFRRKSGG